MTEDSEAPHVDEHGEANDWGVLRASIFGVSDGLVSNLALVMGVAGGLSDASAVVLAGSAGLLAGAFSMAVGEYVSMRTQREAAERELHRERRHLDRYPAQEQAHLADMLEEAGLERAQARTMAATIHREEEPALHFHAVLEFGINPHLLGSPVRAAVFSFFSFVAGAAVPLLPWLVGGRALLGSIVLSGAALLGVGALATRATGVSPWRGALRQLGFGALAAAVTFAIGRWIGQSLA